jgi:CheY-like chemotaxis protein
MNHILLLEDIPEIRAWLKALVKQVFANAQITECSRVQDALSLVNGQRFTLAPTAPRAAREAARGAVGHRHHPR